MRKVFPTLLIVAGITLTILIRQGVINPASWFAAKADDSVQPALIAKTSSEGAFHLLIALNRTENGLHTSPAGKVIQKSQIIQELIKNLNNTIALPKRIPVIVKTCGTANAYYDPAAETIVLCDEWLYLQGEVFSPYYPIQEDFEHAVMGATAFTLFHEIGHALIHQLKLPILGKEEDAADQIATFLLATSGSADLAFRGSEFFAYMAKFQPGESFPFWDEHGLNEQRFYNISCLLYGHDPGRFAFLVANQTLPLDRAQQCPGEAAKLMESMEVLLKPWLKEGAVK